MGKSGSGKSTIVDLLCGLFKEYEGYIKIGENDLTEINISEWRKSIGYISQDPFLFNGSIFDNVKIGNSVRYNDDSDGLDSRIAGYILPESGIYVIRALSYYTPVSNPAAFGSYDVTLELLSDTFAFSSRNLTIHCN